MKRVSDDKIQLFSLSTRSALDEIENKINKQERDHIEKKLLDDKIQTYYATYQFPLGYVWTKGREIIEYNFFTNTSHDGYRVAMFGPVSTFGEDWGIYETMEEAEQVLDTIDGLYRRKDSSCYDEYLFKIFPSDQENWEEDY